MRLEHSDRQTARAELANNGYTVGFSSPRRPELWINPKKRDRRAVLRDRTHGAECWRIVAYPEPSSCLPAEAAALEERDGIVLSGGREPELEHTREAETAWLDAEDETWLE